MSTYRLKNLLSPRSIALYVIIGCCERAEAARPSSPLGSLSPFPARNAAPAIEFPAGTRRSVRYVALHIPPRQLIDATRPLSDRKNYTCLGPSRSIWVPAAVYRGVVSTAESF